MKTIIKNRMEYLEFKKNVTCGTFFKSKIFKSLNKWTAGKSEIDPWFPVIYYPKEFAR